MQFITTVTQKGQITIPLNLREALEIKKYSRVYLELEDNHIRVIPSRDVLDLAGSYQPKQKRNLLKAREAFEKKYSRF